MKLVFLDFFPFPFGLNFRLKSQPNFSDLLLKGRWCCELIYCTLSVGEKLKWHLNLSFQGKFVLITRCITMDFVSSEVKQ